MNDICVGRQPIFNIDLDLVAYEILFRSSEQSMDANVMDGDNATSNVLLAALVDIGLENLVAEHKAFINLTQNFMQHPDMIVMPPDKVVIEVLEDVEPNEEVITALKTLKQKGYTIALDDFIFSEKFRPLLELADIIKIDIKALDEAAISQHIEDLKQYNVQMLAEKIETYEEFEFLKQLDFNYYQGYFFAKPTIIKGKSLPRNKMSIIQLAAKLYDPDIEVSQLSEIISTDISLSHKVLKFINSPSSGLRTQVDSIQHAVTLLGLNTIKNWVTIMALASVMDKPVALSNLTLVRAKTCELLALRSRLSHPDSYFTVGLFSVLDALMDQPLETLLQELPLSDDLKQGLLNKSGSLGKALSCACALEQNDSSIISFLDLDLAELSDIYLQAIKWADEVCAQY